MPRKRYQSQIDAEKRREQKTHLAVLRFPKEEYALFVKEAERLDMTVYELIRFCATNYLNNVIKDD